MNKNSEEPREDAPSGSRFHIVQPHRDPQSNWEVDLAKNLEEYLLKICSGEITGEEDVDHHLSVNFAEAALLLQGSIQVYSRKVEYLYTLVLHALEFISHKRVQDEPQNSSVQAEGNNSQAVVDEENELFLGLDEVPVEAKNSLNDGCSKDDHLNNFVKPPANLVVLEGDCFDSNGDAGELESYLLSTCDLCEDFILLDPCDAEEVHHFLKRGLALRSNAACRSGSVRSKTWKSSFLSPSTKCGETAYKSPFKDKQDVNTNRTTGMKCKLVTGDKNIYQEPAACNPFENDHCVDEMDYGYLDPGNMSVDNDDYEDDDDDPWKPLEPHEPGDLKIKPFKKVKNLGRKKTNSMRRISLAVQWPVAKLNGTTSPEFTEMWESQLHACANSQESDAPWPYEKLRQSLNNGGNDTFNTFTSLEDDEDNENENDIPDFEHGDCDMPADCFMNVEESNKLGDDAHGDDDVHFENTHFGQEDIDPDANLEDLCRSHLDALLASIAETEKQTELAARVSTWKQRIEHTLEDQDLRPPFDIHEYAERVLGKIPLEADNEGIMSFAAVVSGNEKHDVARTFSALLQLVNNGNVDLIRGDSSGQSFCYTAGKPFSVRLLNHQRGRGEVQLRSAKKRMKSPVNNEICDGESSLEFTSSSRTSKTNGKFSVKLGKVSAVRCTPEGKRRRRSRLIEPVELQSTG